MFHAGVRVGVETAVQQEREHISSRQEPVEKQEEQHSKYSLPPLDSALSSSYEEVILLKSGDSGVYNSENSKCLINPNGSLRNKWDFTVMLALIFTAAVTPFETAFLETELNGLFVVNVLITVIFIVDIAFNFMSPVFVNGVWVTDHRMIAFYYAKSWLLIDLVSVFPFDIIGLILDDEKINRLKVLRAVRLLRLAKLLRIFRASRILKRWEARMSMNYSLLTLCKFVLSMVVLAHWMACLFRIVPDIEGGDVNWVTDYLEVDLGMVEGEYGPGTEYLAALYWAAMTVTTIGYGDVVAITDAERFVCILAMMIGGSMYAYIVGAVCGIVASMDELTAMFHRKMDDLNKYMSDLNLPRDMRIKLREYFHRVEYMRRNNHYAGLLQEMSPDLRGEVCFMIHSFWISKLPFVMSSPNYERKTFMTALAMQLRSTCFPPKERVVKPEQPSKHLYIVSKGLLMLNKGYFADLFDDEEKRRSVIGMKNILSSIEKEILTRGRYFGEEMLLTHVRPRYHVVSLSYVELLSIEKNAFFRIFTEHALYETWQHIRKYIIRLAFRIKFVSIAKLLSTAEKRKVKGIIHGKNNQNLNVFEYMKDETKLFELLRSFVNTEMNRDRTRPLSQSPDGGEPGETDVTSPGTNNTRPMERRPPQQLPPLSLSERNTDITES